MNFEKRKTPSTDEMEKPKNEEEKFHAEETINGHEIRCDFANLTGSMEYEMCFPQIDQSSEKASEMHVADQIIKISDEEEEAKFVFSMAKKWAEEEDDVYELYKRVEKLADLL